MQNSEQSPADAEKEIIWGEPRIVSEDDSITIWAQTRTNTKYDFTEIVLTSPQLEEPVRRRGRYEIAEVNISTFPEKLLPFHARCGWSKSQSDHETARQAIDMAIYYIKDIVMKDRYRQSPHDRAGLEKQMTQALENAVQRQDQARQTPPED